MKTWWQLESEVREIARQLDPDIAKLADLGFELLQQGQQAVMGSKWALWEGILGLALGQLENTSACAWELAYCGYYVQSRAMSRLMTEYLAVVWYLPCHKDEAADWNDRSRRPPEAGRLLAAVFADDQVVSDNFHALRKHLHGFAHQSSEGLLAIYDRGADPTDLGINMRAQFDQREFQAVARDLLLLHAAIPGAMADWQGDKNPEWAARVRSYIDRVAGLVDNYDRKLANERRPAPEETGDATSEGDGTAQLRAGD